MGGRRPLRQRSPDPGIPGPLPGLRHQGPDVPIPHLAARRPHRGTDGRLGGPGGRAAQAGCLRPHSLRRSAIPVRGPHLRLADHRPERGCHRLRRDRLGRSARPQAPRRLQLGQPYGLRDAVHLHLQCRSSAGSCSSDDQPRPDHGRALPPCRRDLRAHPRSIDRQDGRHCGGYADLRHGFRLLHPRFSRPAWPFRLRRRVPGLRRVIRHGACDRRSLDHRHGSRGNVPALDVPADCLRRAIRVPAGPRRSPDRDRSDRADHSGSPGIPDRCARALPESRTRSPPRADPGFPGGRRSRGRRLRGYAMSWADLGTIAPVVAAVLVAAAILIVDMILPGHRNAILVTALGGLAVVAVVLLAQAGHSAEAFGGAYSLDNLTVFLDLLFVAIAVLTLLFAVDYLEPRGLPIAEFAAILVFAVTGAMLIAGSTALLLLFVALELMVLPGYMLVGFARRDPYSTEGAIKYFLLGSFSSAILLFGLAYVWGITGTTRVDGVAIALAKVVAGGPLSPGLAMGLAFMSAGVAFKMAAVPFHYWTPDAYQGS